MLPCCNTNHLILISDMRLGLCSGLCSLLIFCDLRSRVAPDRRGRSGRYEAMLGLCCSRHTARHTGHCVMATRCLFAYSFIQIKLKLPPTPLRLLISIKERPLLRDFSDSLLPSMKCQRGCAESQSLFLKADSKDLSEVPDHPKRTRVQGAHWSTGTVSLVTVSIKPDPPAQILAEREREQKEGTGMLRFVPGSAREMSSSRASGMGRSVRTL